MNECRDLLGLLTIVMIIILVKSVFWVAKNSFIDDREAYLRFLEYQNKRLQYLEDHKLIKGED